MLVVSILFEEMENGSSRDQGCEAKMQGCEAFDDTLW